MGLFCPKGCFCNVTWKAPVSVLVCSRSLVHSWTPFTENTASATSTGFIRTAPEEHSDLRESRQVNTY